MSPLSPLVPKRLASLDLLRFFAVLLVIFRHNSLPAQDSPIYGFFAFMLRGGWIGVDLFFVLSGFLIANLFYREIQVHGNVRPGRFLIRRAFKIYPMFWIFVAFGVWGMGAEGMPWKQETFTPKQLHTELLFLQNYWLGWYPVNLWTHTWSLAAEEQFYLLMAMLFALPGLRSERGWKDMRWVPIIGVIALLLCPSLRAWDFFQRGESNLLVQFFPVHLRLDGFFAGILLCHGLYAGWRWLQWSKRTAAFALIGAVVALLPNFILGFAGNPYVIPFGLTVNALAGAVLVHSVQLLLGEGKAKWVRFLSFFGRHSYGIYLWHWLTWTWGTTVMIQLTNSFLPWDNYAVFFGNYLLLSFGVGTLVSIAVERPTLWLRDRLFPSRSIGAQAATVSPPPPTEDDANPPAQSADASAFGLWRQVLGAVLLTGGSVMILANGPVFFHRVDTPVGEYLTLYGRFKGTFFWNFLFILGPALLGMLIYGGSKTWRQALRLAAGLGTTYALLLTFMGEQLDLLWRLNSLSGLVTPETSSWFAPLPLLAALFLLSFCPAPASIFRQR